MSQSIAQLLALVFICTIQSAFAFDPPGRGNHCNYSEHSQGLAAVEEQLLALPRVGNAAMELVNFSDSIQYLIVGENHLDTTPKVLLQSALPLLRAKGFEYLGLEMLNQSAQQLATAYCNGDLSEEEFSQVWSENWAYSVQKQNYLNMVRSACELGFQVIALDIRNEQNLRVPEYERMDARNAAMAEALQSAASNSKAVVLTGSLHAGIRQMTKTTSKHFQQMTRTSILSELYDMQSDLEIESAAVGSRITIIDDERVCPGESFMGYFRQLGPSAPMARVIHRSQYLVFDKVILQAAPAKPVEVAPPAPL
jgi:hypothetical protein